MRGNMSNLFLLNIYGHTNCCKQRQACQVNEQSIYLRCLWYQTTFPTVSPYPPCVVSTKMKNCFLNHLEL